jgi:protein-histidine pros-kinase
MERQGAFRPERGRLTPVDERALLHALYQAGPDAILCVDDRGRILQMNPKASELFGYEEAELIGQSLEVLIPERFRNHHVEQRERFMRDPHTRPMGTGLNIMARRKDGSEFPAAVNLSPQISRGRGFVAAIVADISPLREAERLVRESEERYRALIEHSPDAYVVVVEGRIAYTNSAGLNLFGALTASDIVGQPLLSLIEERSRQFFESRLAELVAGRIPRAQSSEEQVRRLDGQVIDVEVSMAPAQLGERRAAELILRDISERKRAEELQIRALAAEEGEALKTNLLSAVSHELRTPLTTIRGFATTILEYHDRLTQGELMELLRALDRSAQHLERIVGDLLTLSRIESGVLRMEMERVDMRQLLQRCVETRQVLGAGQQINLVLPDQAVVVRGDQVRLLQVLANLLNNASIHGDPAQPVDLTLVDEGRSCVVSVRDRGKGLPEELLQTIFIPYFRGTNHITRASVSVGADQGSGLGLAICKGIIVAHGGEIWADLPEGGGLRVSFRLPKTRRR